MNEQQQLITELMNPSLRDDLRAFVRYVYPWGKEYTPLADVMSPRSWQDALLKDMGDYIVKARYSHEVDKVLPEMYRAAVASGRGIGKSALFSWLAHWMMSTRFGSSVWVAANSEPQLRTKTFPEIAKWVNMSINSHWFDINATSIVPQKWLAEAVTKDLKIDPRYWYIQSQLWAEENPDGFAGAHNVHGEMALFDECSGIPTPIWTVQQGVFTENTIDRYWLGFSNPRRNSGAFYDCFYKNRNFWRNFNIDARTVEGIPQDTYKAIIAAHGENSNEAKIEVYGQFPTSGLNQFIDYQVVIDATQRESYFDSGAPLLMGVDVARFGTDKSVFCFRRGRDAVSLPWKKFIGVDTKQLSDHAAEMASKYKVDAIFVDGNGVGGGVVDNLKAYGYRVIEVQAGSSASDKNKYLNKRVEMWALMKEWLVTGSIPNDNDLIVDLTAIQYDYHETSNVLLFQKKSEMEFSTDCGDSLALTFARPVARIDLKHSRPRVSMAEGVEPFSF